MEDTKTESPSTNTSQSGPQVINNSMELQTITSMTKVTIVLYTKEVFELKVIIIIGICFSD